MKSSGPPEVSVPWPLTAPTLWPALLKKSRPPDVSVRVWPAAISTVLAVKPLVPTLPIRRLFRVVSAATTTAPVTTALRLTLSVGAASAIVLVADVRLEYVGKPSAPSAATPSPGMEVAKSLVLAMAQPPRMPPVSPAVGASGSVRSVPLKLRMTTRLEVPMMPEAPVKLTVPPPTARFRRVMSSWFELPAIPEACGALMNEFEAARVTTPTNSEFFCCWAPRSSRIPPRIVMVAASLRRSFRLVGPLFSKYKPP